MGSSRTIWHLLFAALVRQIAPQSIQTHTEVVLTSESLRADLVLFRDARGPTDAPGGLRGLWGLLAKRAIVEFKSKSRPYRGRDLFRLCAQMSLYFANNDPPGLGATDDLCGVLVVPRRTGRLVRDTKAMGLAWHDLGGGYYRLDGFLFPLYVVDLRVVAATEGDDLVQFFALGAPTTVRVRRWLSEQVGGQNVTMEMRELEGYDEVVRTFVASLTPEERLAGLAPEQRLAGLAPEQRLAGLAPEEAVLALPDDVLRGLSDEYLATLPEPVRAVVRERIGR